MRALNHPRLEHLLFAGYLALFAWLVTKVRFFTRAALTPVQLISIFLIKVMAGIFYGWIGVYYGDMARMVDTWMFQYSSLEETRLLLTHPGRFVTSLFQSNYSTGYSGFLGAENSWWNDLDVNLMLKLMGLFNAASFGHYYINVIFYSFLTLFGPIALYRVFQDYFPGRRIAVLVAVFFIPSFIYWTSGLHKEGLLFNAIALTIYAFYFGWKEQKLTWKKAALVLGSLLTLLALRNYIVMLLLPALLTWAVARKLAWKPAVTYTVIYFLFALFFFIAPHINTKLDFPGAIVGKQEQFQKLTGGSEVPVQPLQPTVRSFLANAPQAFSLALVRPYFSDIRHLLSMAAAVEINALLALFIVYLLWNRKRIRLTPFTLFCLAFSLSVLLIIGYTVNFLGAIVRYRSIVLPLLFVPVIVQVPWEALGHYFFNINDKNNVDNFAPKS